MARIVSVHSFRGGTGKSNLTANLATLVAQAGHRVGIVDTDIQSPGIHVLFGLEEARFERSLNDYLRGACSIQDAAYPVEMPELTGSLSIIPSSLNTGEIARILRDGYDVALLNDGFREIIRRLSLDYLFVDTHPGLNEETLLSITISDVVLLVLRPDRQDYQGTRVTVEVARQLAVPDLFLVMNKVPASFDAAAVGEQAAETFQAPVVGVLAHSDDMMALGSAEVFARAFPDHPLSAALRDIAARIMAAPAGAG